MDLVKLAEDYRRITGSEIDFNCGGCVTKAWQAVEKHNYLNTTKMAKSDKKYILHPGNHQFFAGSGHFYNNENLTDEEAAFFLKAYPRLKSLFVKIPRADKTEV